MLGLVCLPGKISRTFMLLFVRFFFINSVSTCGVTLALSLDRLILGIIDISQVGMLGWLKVSSTEKTAAQNGVHRKPACRVN